MFPITDSTPKAFNAEQPAATDIVIIGGGIIGVMTAWFLAKAGKRVVLCEKGRIAGEQSSRNWGWVRQQGRDPAELPIMIEANRIWRTLAQECGEDLGFRQTGVLYLANTAKDMASFEGWLPHAKAHQLDTKMLSAGAISSMFPSAKANWKGGIWTASDGRAEPWQAVPALARALVRMGVVVIEECAVRKLETSNGKITGVVTEHGHITCNHAVLAGGAWSSLFLRNNGVSIPQLSVRSTVVATAPMPDFFSGDAADNNFAFRRREDGGYTIALGSQHDLYIGPDAFRNVSKFVPQLKASPFGTSYRAAAPQSFPDAWGTKRSWSANDISPFEKLRVLNPAPNTKSIRKMLEHFAKAFPKLGQPQIKTAWAGMIDTMPDVVPIIDHAPSISGLTIATGMSGHGFGIGPGVGRVVADLVLGKPSRHDLTRFRFSRFSDGSKIELGPSL